MDISNIQAITQKVIQAKDSLHGANKLAKSSRFKFNNKSINKFK